LEEVKIPEDFLTLFTEDEKSLIDKELDLVQSFFVEHKKFEFSEEITQKIWDGTIKCNYNALGIFLD